MLKKCPEPRDLVLDPTSIGNPILDDSVRPNGQKVVVKAWTNPERTGDPVDVVLTEFVDPNGIDVYFKIPNLNDTKSIRIVDDELLSEPRQSANGEITMAWYGPKGDSHWKDLFAVDGELVADLAADYQNPQGKQDVPAVFPDKSKSGSWSLFNCKNDALLSTAKESDRKQLNSKFKVDGCPLGYAYGLEGGANLGFFADYMPAQNMEENWGRHFSRDMFDRFIPADQRRQFLITHPIADVDSYNVIRWTPGSQLSGKSIGISGKLFTNPGGNGVSLKLVNWKDDKTPVVLDALYLEQGRKGTGAHRIRVCRSHQSRRPGKARRYCYRQQRELHLRCDGVEAPRLRDRQAVRNARCGRYQKGAVRVPGQVQDGLGQVRRPFRRSRPRSGEDAQTQSARHGR